MSAAAVSQARKAGAALVRRGQRSPTYPVLVAESDGTNENEAVYRPKRGGLFKPKPKPAEELFQVPDILLELDDETSEAVRPLEQEDEIQLQKKWSSSPSRQKASSRVDELKSLIDWSRDQVLGIASQPAPVWSIGSHDVLSTALRGAPSITSIAAFREKMLRCIEDEAQRDIELEVNRVTELQIAEAMQAEEGVHEGPVYPSEEGFLDPQKTPETTSTTLEQNGIGSHALASDNSLLNWLRLRQGHVDNLLLHSQLRKPITPSDFTIVLSKQSSITGIRRLISRSLDSGLDMAAFYTPSHQMNQNGSMTDLSSEIRGACAKILNQNPVNLHPVFEASSMVGNLRARLNMSGVDIGSPLWGLGLNLSARTGNVRSTFEYLRRGLVDQPWEQCPHLIADMLSSLKSYLHHLAYSSNDNLNTALARQELFQLLVGVGENRELKAESFRSCVLKALSHGPNHHIPQAYQAYEYYIKLLGHLGAVRTLWKEWHTTAYDAQERLNSVESQEQTTTTSNIIDAFLPAYTASASVLEPRGRYSTKSGSLADCAILDYAAIDNQKPENWQIRRQQTPQGAEEGEAGAVGEHLSSPLENWLQAVDDRALKLRIATRLIDRPALS